MDSFDYQNFTYSDGLDANGYRTGITAQDYVTLPDNVAALPIKKADVTPSDSDVQARIDSLLSQYSTNQAVTDRAAQNGDVVHTVEALRTYFSDALYDQNLEDAIMDSLLDNAAFKDLPSEVPGYYACMFLNYYYQLASYYSSDLDTIAQAQGYTDANAMLGASDSVITHLAKQDLLYQAIAESQGIEPTQEQLDAAAASYSGSSYGDNFVHQTALQTAVMEWLKTNAVVS